MSSTVSRPSIPAPPRSHVSAVVPELMPISHRVPRPRPLIPWPDLALRMRSCEVNVEQVRGDDEALADLCALVDDLFATMYAGRAVGLAAIQAGVLLRVIVIDLAAAGAGAPVRGSRPIVLVNPRLLEERGLVVGTEGCLSLPGQAAEVARPTRVRMSAFDRDLRPIEIDATHLLARVLLHELDHLDGVLMIDKSVPRR